MHVPLTDLWLPIVLSTAAVFVASFLAWMVSPHHRGDVKRLPNEAGFLEGVRTNNTPPGTYLFPWCDNPGRFKDPEFRKAWLAGPHGLLTIRPGPPNMARNLGLTLVVYLVIGLFVAYLTSLACPVGAPYLRVFRVAGSAAVMSYCLGMYCHAIWMNRPLRGVVMDTVDGVIYGMLTAGFFGWLWPQPDAD